MARWHGQSLHAVASTASAVLASKYASRGRGLYYPGERFVDTALKLHTTPVASREYGGGDVLCVRKETKFEKRAEAEGTWPCYARDNHQFEIQMAFDGHWALQAEEPDWG
jgi:hypothetical protein